MLKKSWWVDFRSNHRRYRKRSPENSKAGALAYEAVLRGKLARGESIDVNKDDPIEQSFEEFAWKWFDEYVRSNNKFNEQRGKQYILNASLIPFFGRLSVSEISEQHIERYKARALKGGAKQKTVNNRLTVLSKCLSIAYEWLHLDGQPPRVKRLKCPQPMTSYLTEEECGMLLSSASGSTRELVLLALRTGMRQGEIKGLQWECVDWENRQLIVRYSYCDYRQVLDSPKSNRERVIPMDNEVYAMLHGRRKNMGFVFLNANKQPFNNKSMERKLTALCKRAGVKRVTWHQLRHTFASHLAMKGVPLNVVQVLLGHSTIATTMRYAHVAPSSLRTAISLLNPKTLFSEDFGQPVGNQWSTAQNVEAQQKKGVAEKASRYALESVQNGE